MESAIYRDLIQIAHLDPKAQWTHVAGKQLLWRDVLEVAKAENKLQFDNKEWPPAKHATDLKKVSSRFGGNAVAQAKVSKPLAQALVPRNGGGTNNSNCFGCGS